MMLRWLVALPLLVPACFHPNYDHPRCGPSGECPSGLTCSAQQTCDPAPSDGPTEIDTLPGICIGRFVLVCRPVLPPNLAFPATATINTDTDPRCELQGQGAGAPQLCVMAGTDIVVDASITVVGSYPLMLAAFSDLNITAKGNLVLTSPSGQPIAAGGNDPACHPPVAGGNGTGGSGGGAGGSFGGSGGAGGGGDGINAAAGSAGAPLTPTVRVTGGCKGSPGGDVGLTSGGSPGNGGGAVMLLAAHNLTLAGIVTAGGGGGGAAPSASTAYGGGGGGGGSGGFVGLEAMIYAITGRVTANGGGGASGWGADGTMALPGTTGTSSTTVAAPGGISSVVPSSGGSGSIATQRDGGQGQGAYNSGSGGGGGGGAGVILVKGAAPTGGSYSPPLTIVP